MNLICTSDPRRRGLNLPERMGNIHVTRILMNSFRESEWARRHSEAALSCVVHTHILVRFELVVGDGVLKDRFCHS